jgi:hypothetical protein
MTEVATYDPDYSVKEFTWGATEKAALAKVVNLSIKQDAIAKEINGTVDELEKCGATDVQALIEALVLVDADRIEMVNSQVLARCMQLGLIRVMMSVRVWSARDDG